LLKPFLHERTKNKVSIYGSDSAAWKAAILQDVDAAQLPVFYGGTMTDPDGNPQCLTKVSDGTMAIGCLRSRGSPFPPIPALVFNLFYV